jgi:hypothetical protein
VPAIHDRIAANQTEKTAADMKAYTNFIPGTDVSYAMTPIPAQPPARPCGPPARRLASRMAFGSLASDMAQKE